MKNVYKKHVFVCENQMRPSSKKSCGKVGHLLRLKLKREIIRKRLNSEIRINKLGV